jgi:phosphonate ABC transporter permease subunit PhnE
MTNDTPPVTKKEKTSVWSSLRNGVFFAIAIMTIAYAFQVTNVNLEEFRKESRQQSRIRVMRALANPDIFDFDRDETVVIAPILLPCPPTGLQDLPAAETNQPYIQIPSCTEPGVKIFVNGFNFPSNSSGVISFIPGNDPDSVLSLTKGQFRADANGHFSVEIEMPRDRASDDTQFIRAFSYKNVGWPRWSQSATLTWDKIIETVFMAFLATLLGTILSFPLSFLAARNLMKNVKSPLTSIAFSIIGWPLGIVIGYQFAKYLLALSESLGTTIVFNFVGSFGTGTLLLFSLRWFFARNDADTISASQRLAQQLITIIVSLLTIYGVLEFGNLTMKIGEALIVPFGSFGFIGNFLFQSGDILRTITPVLAAFIGGGMLSGVLGKLGQSLNEKLSVTLVRVVNLILAAITGAMLFVALGQTLDWFYQIENNLYTLTAPALFGGLAGVALALFTKPKVSLQIGMVVYYITRTIVNAVRSVEAVIMAIVFVIFVGIGPFAGVMALSLHTIASLVKLYSEQVESIAAGPLEAIEATGANRLQTIIYAVIPQIIPPYISYTMYRWDINVRMSTIIGITGGGGIGFLLVQNINLLDYNAAATQMLAIAIVVASMDYVSSMLREKVI